MFRRTGTPDERRHPPDHDTAGREGRAQRMSQQPPTAASPVIAEQHRIERTVASLKTGESTVINGTKVTAISLTVAEAITTHETAAARAARLAAKAASGENLPAIDVRAWEFAEELMAGAKATLAAAGCLNLIA